MSFEAAPEPREMVEVARNTSQVCVIDLFFKFYMKKINDFNRYFYLDKSRLYGTRLFFKDVKEGGPRRGQLN